MRTRLLVLALLFCAFALPASATAVYDLADDWTTAIGGTSPWSYGQYAAGLNPVSYNAYSQHRFLDGGALSEHWTGGAADPNIIKNLTNVDNPLCCTITFHANAVTFGPFLGPTVARWTAPMDGHYQVDAYFATVQDVNGFPNAYIGNGNMLTDLGLVPAYAGTLEASGLAYSEKLWLSAGQNVDFVVWGGDAENKTTEVSARIEKMIPEPSAALVFGAGLALVARRIRRSAMRQIGR